MGVQEVIPEPNIKRTILVLFALEFWYPVLNLIFSIGNEGASIILGALYFLGLLIFLVIQINFFSQIKHLWRKVNKIEKTAILLFVLQECFFVIFFDSF